MKIKKGIMIHNQLPDGYDAISINSGTVHHTKQKTDPVNYQGYSFVPKYCEHAYVTKRDWRKIEQSEINCLRANGNRKDHNTIYLGDISEAMKERFEELELHDCVHKDDVMKKFKKDPKKTLALSNAMADYLTPFAAGKPFRFHFLGSNLPNIEMVACDTTVMPPGYKEEDKEYMGIHNDGTEEMTIHTTYKFGNRFTINLGKETRSFVFVNLSLKQAYNMLKKKIDVKAHDVSIYNIPRIFFKHFPNYPVIRIRQKPYQYYIAPTDNCLHDGSTLGNKELDMIMVYFGNFQY